LTIRHLVRPVAVFGLARVFGPDPVQTTVLLAFSAMSAAPSACVLAARMGYDGADMAGLVTLSTLPGMVSPPLALGTLRGLQGQLQGLGGGIRRQGSAHRPGQRNPI
jgi:malonate transporter and related proteins